MKLAVTPQQRYHLYQLLAGAALRVKGQEARRLRRFYRHLGLEPLAEAEARAGAVDVARTRDAKPAFHALDGEGEDIARLHKLDEETERSPATEYVLGPLFETVAACIAGGKAENDAVAADSETSDIPDYVPEPLDSWMPVKVLQAPEEAELELVIAYLKANPSKTGAELAELLDKGDHRPA
jgi:hypothetical protein